MADSTNATNERSTLENGATPGKRNFDDLLGELERAKQETERFRLRANQEAERAEGANQAAEGAKQETERFRLRILDLEVAARSRDDPSILSLTESSLPVITVDPAFVLKDLSKAFYAEEEIPFPTYDAAQEKGVVVERVLEESILSVVNTLRENNDATTTTTSTTGTVSGSINREELVKLIDNPDEAGWSNVAADTANLHFPPIPSRSGEMFLQQCIYAPIAYLFVAFQPENYIANQDVGNAFTVSQEDNGEQKQCSVCCKPDGAIALVRSPTGQACCVWAMMELKSADATPADVQHDKRKCLLMTCMSLLSFKKIWNDTGTDTGTGTIEKVAIPFVFGRGTMAELYITRFRNNRPEIQLVMLADFTEFHQKTKFIAILAVLISDLKSVLKYIQDNMKNTLINSHQKILDGKSKYPNALSSRQSTAINQESGATREQENAGQRRAESGPRNAAARNGLVTLESLPSSDVIHVSGLVLTPIYTQRHQQPQEKSPFVFCGHVHDGDNDAVPVFCKVWREGDRKTRRDTILKEIHFLKLAYTAGVPTPRVLDEDLTCMDISPPSEKEMYHVLVMQKLRNDHVDAADIWEYAMSLVQGINKLHSIGVLHCDIKNDNVLWDSKRKRAMIVDFGHAQNELNARCYNATEMYQAPETLSGVAHSRKSDAYSVGLTLQVVLANCFVPPNGSTALSVKSLGKLIELLVAKSPEDRTSLEKFEALLVPAFSAGPSAQETGKSSAIPRFLAGGRVPPNSPRKSDVPETKDRASGESPNLVKDDAIQSFQPQSASIYTGHAVSDMV
jgi:tRNA A-37 threonylcarbamoyl transferase component Bud32